MDTKLVDDVFLDQVAFIGETLGPFYLEDPKLGCASEAFAAIGSLDVDETAAAWPFVEESRAVTCLSKMKEGLSDGTDSEDLMWEFRRLFIGPEAKPAPPWGSVYTDRECVVFGASTLALRRWMREVGIKRLGDDNDPEDHIGLMLLLMAWIARNKPERLEEYLVGHLLTWSSHFLDELVDAAGQPFYEGLASLTKASLEGVQHQLGREVEYPRYYR